MLSRLESLLRRHGSTFAALTVLAILTPIIFRSLFQLAPRYVEVESSSPWFLLAALRHFGDLWPDRPFLRLGLSGADVFGLLISGGAALGMFMASWRLTGNRIASFAAGWLYASHPSLVLATGSAGYDDRLGALGLAWAVAFQLGRGRGSGRFPTRRPSRFRRMAFAVLLLSLFVTSAAWWIGLALVLVDLALGHRGERLEWKKLPLKGYLPYLAVSLFSFLLTFFSAAPRGLFEGGPAAYLVWATFTPVFEPSGLWWRLLLWCLLLAGLGLCAFDLATGLLAKRFVLRCAAFAGGSLALFVLLEPLVAVATPLRGGPVAFFGAALFLPALAWRLVLKAWPEHPAIEARPAAPTFAELSAAVPQEPLPALALLDPSAPAWSDEPSPPGGATASSMPAAGAKEREADLNQLYARLVRPLYSGDGLALEIAAAGGRFRESSRLAVARRDVVVLIPGAAVPDEARQLFEGLEGLQVLPLGPSAPLPSREAEAAALFLPEGCAVLARTAFETLTEAARVLRSEGVLAGRVTRREIESGRGPDLDEVGALFARTGFRVETVESAASGGYVFVARRLER